jgi:hypothetical protein
MSGLLLVACLLPEKKPSQNTEDEKIAKHYYFNLPLRGRQAYVSRGRIIRSSTVNIPEPVLGGSFAPSFFGGVLK